MSCAHKNPDRRKNLSYRLVRSFAVPFVIAALLLSLCVYWLARESLFSHCAEELTESLGIMRERYTTGITQDGHAFDDPDLVEELNTASDMAVALILPDGRTLSRAEFAFQADTLPELEDGRLLYRQPDGMTLMVCEEEISVGTSSVRLVAALEINWIGAYLRWLAWILVVVNAAGILAAIVIGQITARNMLAPIKAMIQKTREIDETALDTRLSVPEADDELRQLALTVNGLLDRVEAAFERQKQFTQNASHELRTPLAVMQGNTDILIRWGSRDPDTVDKCAEAIRRQLDYMNKLVNNLLFLTRGDSRSQLLELSPVTAAQLEEIIEDRREIDPEHRYILEAREDLALRADASMLRQLLFILLDNAARYTPGGGGIRVEAETLEHETRLTVSDEGCGVPEDQLDKIFERFYRIDKARSRATGGTGLGLSIARTIAELHGGSAHAEQNVPKGLKVIVLIPNIK